MKNDHVVIIVKKIIVINHKTFKAQEDLFT